MWNAESKKEGGWIPAVQAEYPDAMDAAASLLEGKTTIDGDDEEEGFAVPHRPSFQELHKELAMAWHARDRERFGCVEPSMEFRRPADGRRYRSASTASCCPCPSPGVPLEGLRAISLRELRLGKVHSGRVLLGSLCAEAFVVRGVMSVLQDAVFPSLAVRISVYNASDEDKHRLLSNGSSIAVKEPFLKRAKDGLLVLRVDNPADIEMLSSLPLLRRLPTEPPTSLRTTEAGKLRRMGNRLLKQEDWRGAINCYTRCISAVEQQLFTANSSCRSRSRNHVVDLTALLPASEPEPRSVKVQALRWNGNNPAAGEMLVSAFSNRAEAWMRLCKFQQALKDSEAALCIDPSHLSSLLRKDRALRGLQQLHQVVGTAPPGCCSFQPQKRSSPYAAGINPRTHEPRHFPWHRGSKLLLRPPHILAGYSDFLLGIGPPPILPDFIGPVVIRTSTSTSNGGRGLFASSHVKRGGLLLVSNALATCPDSSSHHGGLVAKLISLAMSSQKHLRLIYTLCASSACSSMAVPSMDLFTAEAPTAAPVEILEVDVSRIRSIVRHNSFATSMIGGTCIARNMAGLWLLPSFINHSCVPNAAWTVVKEAMVIHAASDIYAGQEITMPYFDTLVPLKVRQKCCSNWDFVCGCDRCVVEKSVEGAMDNMVRRFRYLYDQAADEYTSVLSKRSWNGAYPACAMVWELYARIKEEVDGLDGLTGREKKWVLGSFTHAFAAKYFVEWEEAGKGMDGGEVEEAWEAGRECEPGSVITVNVAARMYVGAKDRRRSGGGDSSSSSGGGGGDSSSSGGGGGGDSSNSGGGGVELLPLLQELKKDCIAHFGELNTDDDEEEILVVDKLLRRLADRMPAF